MKFKSIILGLCIIFFCTNQLFIPHTLTVQSLQSDWQNSYANSFEGGDGTNDNPYIIHTPEQFARVAYLISIEEENDKHIKYSNCNYKIDSDIDLSGRFWTPIGDSTNSFCGVLDGCGHKITGLAIKFNQRSKTYAGLFGYNNGTICNLLVSGKIDATALGESYLGVLAGYNSGKISTCGVNAEVNFVSSGKKNVFAAGIAGYNDGSLISSYVTGKFNIENDYDISTGALTAAGNGNITSCYYSDSLSNIESPIEKDFKVSEEDLKRGTIASKMNNELESSSAYYFSLDDDGNYPNIKTKSYFTLNNALVTGGFNKDDKYYFEPLKEVKLQACIPEKGYVFGYWNTEKIDGSDLNLLQDSKLGKSGGKDERGKKVLVFEMPYKSGFELTAVNYEDNIPPTGEISFAGTETLLYDLDSPRDNSIYVNSAQQVVIIADDNYEIEKIEYIIKKVDDNFKYVEFPGEDDDWKEYDYNNKPVISEKCKHIVYAKITDEAGMTTKIASDVLTIAEPDDTDDSDDSNDSNDSDSKDDNDSEDSNDSGGNSDSEDSNNSDGDSDSEDNNNNSDHNDSNKDNSSNGDNRGSSFIDTGIGNIVILLIVIMLASCNVLVAYILKIRKKNR